MPAATRSYKKVARARSEERTRSDLLDAAERAFFSGSWDKTTLEEVAADAGTTKRSTCQTAIRLSGQQHLANRSVMLFNLEPTLACPSWKRCGC